MPYNPVLAKFFPPNSTNRYKGQMGDLYGFPPPNVPPFLTHNKFPPVDNIARMLRYSQLNSLAQRPFSYDTFHRNPSDVHRAPVRRFTGPRDSPPSNRTTDQSKTTSGPRSSPAQNSSPVKTASPVVSTGLKKKKMQKGKFSTSNSSADKSSTYEERVAKIIVSSTLAPGGGKLVSSRDEKGQMHVRVEYERDQVIRCAHSPYSMLPPAALKNIVMTIPEIVAQYPVRHGLDMPICPEFL